MSKDIRSFFSAMSKKNVPSKVQECKKKVKRLIDSDDEDVIESTPETKRINPFALKRKPEVVIINSDSEEDQVKKETKLKPVNIEDIFSNQPIKQSKTESLPRGEAVKIQEKEKSNKSKKKKAKPIHDDDAFEKTLLELDDDLLTENLDILDKTAEEALNIEIKTKTHETEKRDYKVDKYESKGDEKSKGKKMKTESDVHSDNAFEKTLKELDSENVKSKKTDGSPEISIIEDVDAKQSSSKENSPKKPKDEKKTKRQRTPSEDSTPKKRKLEHTDSGIDPDQEACEKRIYSAMLYQRYKDRGGPLMHGQKELPRGNPDCLRDLTFLRTGVLDSLDGEDFQNLAKDHGGRVVHAVSKKVNYVVVGREAGPAKLAKSRGYNIPEINEDGFLDLILVKSGKKPKYSQKEKKPDSGVFSSDDDIQSNTKQNGKKKHEEKKTYAENFKNEEKPDKPQSKDKEKGSGKLKFNTLKTYTQDKTIEKEKTDTRDKTTEKEKTDTQTKKSQDKTTEKKQHHTSSFWTDKSKRTKASHTSSVSTKIHDPSETLQPSKFYPQNKQKPANETSNTSENLQISSTDSGGSLAWTEKYKPADTQSIIGQQGDSSNMNKLRKWLLNWYRNQVPKVRKKIPRPSPWARSDDGAYFKAALLSGPPGVGKTTTATLLSKELGLDVVEFNASDTRSKRLLHEEVSQLLSTTTIAGFAAGKSRTDKKRVLLMDEVDGMAGNEDRGGIQELINLIKTTSVPIICMCNDRNHQKMRSLVNYCFDLRFAKPKLEQIRGAMMSICFKEGLKIPPNIVSEIISGTGCDIRQTLNHLTMWSAQNNNVTLEEVQNKAKESKKDTILGPWEVVRMVFNKSDQKNMSLPDKSKLFFYDYSMGPLFVQENYLNVTPDCPKSDIMKRVALAADSISKGDLIDAKIRSSNNWSLLESQAMYSSVLPGYYMSGHVSNRINFPGWFGKNSSTNKRKRMLTELHVHSRISTSGNILAMKLDYLLPLRNAIINPLLKYGNDGIQQSIAVMDNYNLLREDLTNLLELCQWKDTKNPFNNLDSRVKSAFTRTYNKVSRKLPFAPGAGFSKKKTSQGDNPEDEENMVESDVDEDDGEKDDVTTDSLIKVGTGNKKGKSKASSSKTKDTSSGKGKTKKSK